MPLLTGTRLGPYEIDRLLGAGGMGEVYKARDTRLDRIVAIKLLPSHVAADPDLRQRFEREARAVAALNHPHICTLHDVGQHEGTDYLVLEHLDGETLATRLERGAVPLTETLMLGVQVADALDRAHRAGIVHRDLKPANIMITRGGAVRQGSLQAKLLDFGLAKVIPARGSVAGPSMLVTAAAPLTGQGTILGTLHYMAPEQVEGGDCDARTDIFALGSILYEMISGRRAFDGKSSASVMAAILERDPPALTAAQPLTPPILGHLIQRCLAKDPDARWQSAGDVMRELAWITEGGATASPAPDGATTDRRPSRLPWIAAAASLLVALAAGAAVLYRQAPDESPPLRFATAPTAGFGLDTSFAFTPNLALSPDGRHLTYVATSADGVRMLWLRPMDDIDGRPLAGTEGGSSPFWSPDSRFIGFFAAGKLRKIDIAGGPAITLADAANQRGGTWHQDGTIVFAPVLGQPLQKVSSAGGVPAPAAPLTTAERGHARPVFLPGSRHFVFNLLFSDPQAGGGWFVGSLDNPDEARPVPDLVTTSMNVAVSGGHVLFLRDRTLMAQPFEFPDMTPLGEPVALVDQVGAQGGTLGMFSVSQEGTIAYQSAASQQFQLLWFDRAGRRVGEVGAPAAYNNLEMSPDGSRVAISVLEAGKTTRDIWVFDVARGIGTRLTFDPADERSAIWSPDGSRIVWNVARDQVARELYVRRADGAGSQDVVLEDGRSKDPQMWSPDGRFLMYRVSSPSGGNDIAVLPMDADGSSKPGTAEARKPIPIADTRFNENYGRFSPDGRWIAYMSEETGREQVYVTSFPPGGGKWQVSVNGGTLPRWRRDGRELYYVAADATLTAVDVEARGPTFVPGAARGLFKVSLPQDAGHQFDVTADGQRFLVTSDVAPPASIHVVVNWTTLLPR